MAASVQEAAHAIDGATSAERVFDALTAADPVRVSAATAALERALAAHRIEFGGSLLPTSIKPHFLRRADNDLWTRRLADFIDVLDRTARRLCADPAFRRTGPFAPAVWELLDIDPGFGRAAVVCRPDVVWRGSEIAVLELNADSPAMMVYSDVVQELQRELFPLDQFGSDELVFERRTPALHAALLATYREWGGTSAHPVIAIVDWPDQKTSGEQELLARALAALGTPAFVCHPAELETRGGRLLARGQQIDIVQRRILFPEILRRSDELVPFLTAYRERLACVVNPLSSYAIGCKAVLAELSRLCRCGGLAEPERTTVARVLPTTASLSELDDDELEDRERWVLKPSFGSGGSGVIIGRFVDDATWRARLLAARRRASDWIVQLSQPIPRYRVPVANGSDALFTNWSPFFFAGTPAGSIARASADPVVGISARGALLPTILVESG
jgi:hypothetical protein